MITYRKVDNNYLAKYDSIDMLVHVKSIYRPEKIDRGLGGILLKETSVKEYVKDFRQYDNTTDWAKEFDLTSWVFFMAFDDSRPVGGATIVSKTKTIHMLEGRNDLCVLWDLRVSDAYKHRVSGKPYLIWPSAGGRSRAISN